MKNLFKNLFSKSEPIQKPIVVPIHEGYIEIRYNGGRIKGLARVREIKRDGRFCECELVRHNLDPVFTTEIKNLVKILETDKIEWLPTIYPEIKN